MKSKISVTYIYHDCFVVETERHCLIFDYWKDPLAGIEGKDFPPLLDEIDTSKKIYVIVSHHHKDHFSRRIFYWQERFPGMEYIISEDTFRAVKYMLKEGGTYQGTRPKSGSVHVLQPGDKYCGGEDFRIRAYASTDTGNSYAVECDGRKIFHAGDLNAWLWIGESTPKEVAEAREDYLRILDNIGEEYREFDVAMFPVDSRMDKEYWWGAAQFVRKFRIDFFIPMHFELVMAPEEKEQRRMDAARFSLFENPDYGCYVQLCATRSKLVCNKL